MQRPLTLIHVSDLHFVNEQSFINGLKENGKLITKRHLGWLNHKLRRQKYFNNDLKSVLIRRLLEMEWDYLIITGDITTLALESEFELARQALDPLINKGKVIFTTGNHDRYVKTRPVSNLLYKYFADCWPFNQTSFQDSHYSFLEISEFAVILELNMARPKSFYSSRGKLCKDLTVIKDKLKNSYKDRLKLAIGHYPAYLPPGEHEGFFHSLSGKKRLRRILQEFDFHYYLHGHIHKSWSFKPLETYDLTCVNSGGCCRYTEGEWAGFHKISIAPENTFVERLHIQ
ncbi:MAG: metallophosphoesterase [Proteobacteria bacterium]|nr:metallophosphoesterase [Pseudomonadota bacterium]